VQTPAWAMGFMARVCAREGRAFSTTLRTPRAAAALGTRALAGVRVASRGGPCRSAFKERFVVCLWCTPTRRTWFQDKEVGPARGGRRRPFSFALESLDREGPAPAGGGGVAEE